MRLLRLLHSLRFRVAGGPSGEALTTFGCRSCRSAAYRRPVGKALIDPAKLFERIENMTAEIEALKYRSGTSDTTPSPPGMSDGFALDSGHLLDRGVANSLLFEHFRIEQRIFNPSI